MKTILRIVLATILLIAAGSTPVLAGGPSPTPICPVLPCPIGK